MKVVTVSVTLAVPTDPSPLAAVTVMTLVPAKSGTSACQLVVPVAKPEGPRLLVHVTAATALPDAEAAVPAIVRNGLVADAVAVAGEVIVTPGADAAPTVRTKVSEEVNVPSLTVTVMVVVPD